MGMMTELSWPIIQALELGQYTGFALDLPRKEQRGISPVFLEGTAGITLSGWETQIMRPGLSFITALERLDNSNEGVDNFNLSVWNRWYHIACSNGGIGGVARTYVDGTFIENNQRYERKVMEI
jgi:hypothetical protein